MDSNEKMNEDVTVIIVSIQISRLLLQSQQSAAALTRDNLQ